MILKKHDTTKSEAPVEKPTAVGRLLDVSPLGGETIDRGEMPITLKLGRDKWGGEAVILTIGEGLGRRDITIDVMETLKLDEQLNRLTTEIIDLAKARLGEGE